MLVKSSRATSLVDLTGEVVITALANGIDRTPLRMGLASRKRI